MKRNTFFLTLVMLLSFYVYAAEPQIDKNDWLEKMKEIFGEEQPTKTSISSIEIRELKYPGQRFEHIAKTDIVGEGQLHKAHKYWWNTNKNFTFQHETTFIILEDVISTQEELNEGIIKTKFTVQRFNERLKSAKGNMQFGIVSSKDLQKSIKEFGENYGTAIDATAGTLILAGLGALTAPEPVMTKGAAALSIGGGVLLKLSSWLVFDKMAEQYDEDGNRILSDQQVKDYFPDCSKVIERIHNLEGTVVLTTWVADEGYTQFEIVGIPELKEDEKEMIAKVVYRFNPVGVNSILPKDKKKNNVWDINVNNVLGGILTSTGINFNSLEGRIWVKDCGIGRDHFDDEEALTQQKETDITTLKTSDLYDNNISFRKKFDDDSQLNINARPAGTIVIVTPQNGREGPRYVKSVDMTGTVLDHLDKPSGLLTDIVFEENSVDINVIYTQYRMPDAQ